MVFHVFVLLLALAAGFAAGRVKNRAKLSAIEAEITKIEQEAVVDAKSVVARIKKVLHADQSTMAVVN